MKISALSPWLKGNESVTPKNFFGGFSPDFSLGSFIALDEAVDLYRANEITTGSLADSWRNNKEYIDKACKIADVGEDNGYDLDHEEKAWILDELGEPPESSYNLYIVTIYNNTVEKIVYVGKTDTKISRFKNGHKVALKLHHPKYNGYNKRIYFGTVMLLSGNDYLPLEFVTPLDKAQRILSDFEAILIKEFKPELNVKRESIKLVDSTIVHIQNFSEVTSFLNDHFIYH